MKRISTSPFSERVAANRVARREMKIMVAIGLQLGVEKRNAQHNRFGKGHVNGNCGIMGSSKGIS